LQNKPLLLDSRKRAERESNWHDRKGLQAFAEKQRRTRKPGRGPIEEPLVLVKGPPVTRCAENHGRVRAEQRFRAKLSVQQPSAAGLAGKRRLVKRQGHAHVRTDPPVGKFLTSACLCRFTSLRL